MTFRFDNLILSPVRKFHNHSQKSSGIPGTFICAEIVSPLFFYPLRYTGHSKLQFGVE